MAQVREGIHRLELAEVIQYLAQLQQQAVEVVTEQDHTLYRVV